MNDGRNNKLKVYDEAHIVLRDRLDTIGEVLIKKVDNLKSVDSEFLLHFIQLHEIFEDDDGVVHDQ